MRKSSGGEEWGGRICKAVEERMERKAEERPEGEEKGEDECKRRGRLVGTGIVKRWRATDT